MKRRKKPGFYCSQGKVHLDQIPSPPIIIKNLYQESSFLNQLRKYTTASHWPPLALVTKSYNKITDQLWQFRAKCITWLILCILLTAEILSFHSYTFMTPKMKLQTVCCTIQIWIIHGLSLCKRFFMKKICTYDCFRQNIKNISQQCIYPKYSQYNAG